MSALDEIVDIRAAAGRSPRVDAAVLRQLWRGGCPPDQLAELLGILADSHPSDVVDWFAAEISAASARGATSSGWLALAEALADHPIMAVLPEAETRSVRNTVRVLPLLQRAYMNGPRGTRTCSPSLFGEYISADDDTRRLLEGRLPGLLARARPLGVALRGCPDEVAAAFCDQLRDWLAPMRADIRLARRVFIASSHPDLAAPRALCERLLVAFEPVRRWSRRDLGALAQSMDNDADLAQAFRQWRKARRGELARKLLGGAEPPARGHDGEPDRCPSCTRCSSSWARCSTWPMWPAPCPIGAIAAFAVYSLGMPVAYLIGLGRVLVRRGPSLPSPARRPKIPARADPAVLAVFLRARSGRRRSRGTDRLPGVPAPLAARQPHRSVGLRR